MDEIFPNTTSSLIFPYAGMIINIYAHNHEAREGIRIQKKIVHEKVALDEIFKAPREIILEELEKHKWIKGPNKDSLLVLRKIELDEISLL